MASATQPVALGAATILDLELDGIKLIEASAGTGKTHTIADLYLRHILAGREPAQVLIVTYTNAATEELRGRIRARLYQASRLFDSEPPEDDEFLQLLKQRWDSLDEATLAPQRQRLQYALRAMDQASISTIHSFCQQALQEHALSSNRFFETEMLDNDDPLWDQAVKDWWRRQTYAFDDTRWRLLRNRLPGVEALVKLVLELRNRPGALLLPRAEDDLESLMAQARSVTEALFCLAPDWQAQRSELCETLTGSKVLSRSQKLPYHPKNIEAFITAADDFFSAEDPRAPFAGFEYLGADCLDEHSKPKSRGQDPGLRHAFFRAVDPVVEDWKRLQAALEPALRIDAWRAAAAQVREQKHRSATLAFQDQLTLLLEALEADGGERLAQRLRRRYPVAMIDEFQDTDDIQYRIFSRIYLNAGEIGLTLIGDPKQAIYSFRGGDIFTYMRARQLEQAALFNLPTNWRSHPDLVTAINAFFTRRDDAFVYTDAIDFIPALAAGVNDDQRLRWPQGDATPLTIWQLPQKPDGDNYARGEMRELIYQAIADEISAMLERGASIAEDPVNCGDIAVLVRTGGEGRALGRVLNRRGIGTVTIGGDSVFESEEARGLYDLLLAIAWYQDPAFASRSLASALLQLDYRQIAAIVDHDDRWQEWIDRLARLQQLWQRHGFIPMFQNLLQELEVTTRLAQLDAGERRITNLMHLAELLQQRSGDGIDALLGWFSRQFDEPSREESELRLEGDEALVKIVTIHKSKGLQYPVVFVPFLWSCKPVPKSGAIYFHDSALRASIDLGSGQLEANRLRAEKERLAEDLRLLYVALTRARAKVYLAWGQVGQESYDGYASQTALAYLLHSRQTPDDLERQSPNGFPDGMDFGGDLDALVDRGAGCIEVVPLAPDPGVTRNVSLAESPTPQLARFSRTRLATWRINSFTAMTRGVHQPAQIGSADSQGDPILDFPAGSHVGLMLHALLEQLDFQADLAPQCEPLFTRLLPAAGNFSESDQHTLLGWLDNILRTPLDDDGLRLDCISSAKRLNELEFDLALDQLDIEALNHELQSLAQQRLIPIESPGFEGLINGIIDIVFEYRGRFYLADYKSNFLGGSIEDYRPERLQQAMWQRRYDLQSLIYTIALHRMLRQRLPDYDYERHFGGSYYLFLRAMRPSHGNAYGVYFERPELATIETFERLFECGGKP